MRDEKAKSSGTRPVSIKGISQVTGFSVTTVSMVLNNRPNTRLSEQAAERVRAAAAALDYRPNPAARGLRRSMRESSSSLPPPRTTRACSVSRCGPRCRLR